MPPVPQSSSPPCYHVLTSNRATDPQRYFQRSAAPSPMSLTGSSNSDHPSQRGSSDPELQEHVVHSGGHFMSDSVTAYSQLQETQGEPRPVAAFASTFLNDEPMAEACALHSLSPATPKQSLELWLEDVFHATSDVYPSSTPITTSPSVISTASMEPGHLIAPPVIASSSSMPFPGRHSIAVHGELARQGSEIAKGREEAWDSPALSFSSSVSSHVPLMPTQVSTSRLCAVKSLRTIPLSALSFNNSCRGSQFVNRDAVLTGNKAVDKENRDSAGPQSITGTPLLNPQPLAKTLFARQNSRRTRDHSQLLYARPNAADVSPIPTAFSQWKSSCELGSSPVIVSFYWTKSHAGPGQIDVFLRRSTVMPRTLDSPKYEATATVERSSIQGPVPSDPAAAAESSKGAIPPAPSLNIDYGSAQKRKREHRPDSDDPDDRTELRSQRIKGGTQQTVYQSAERPILGDPDELAATGPTENTSDDSIEENMQELATTAVAGCSVAELSSISASAAKLLSNVEIEYMFPWLQQVPTACTMPPPSLSSKDSCAGATIIRHKARSESDLYTPRWTRGTGSSKQGLCPICMPREEVWLKTKSSRYWHHLQYRHGVSASTGFRLPLPERVQFRNRSLVKMPETRSTQTAKLQSTQRSTAHASTRTGKSHRQESSPHYASSSVAAVSTLLSMLEEIQTELTKARVDEMLSDPASGVAVSIQSLASMLDVVPSALCSKCQEWVLLGSVKKETPAAAEVSWWKHSRQCQRAAL